MDPIGSIVTFRYLVLLDGLIWPDVQTWANRISKERIEEHHLLLDLTSHTPKLQQELHLFPQMLRKISPKILRKRHSRFLGTNKKLILGQKEWLWDE